ncbi:hypothetical protein LFYK43_22250 [Ligilactobacillus salitolerans]|uniref:Bacteriophage lysin domain-containing protein n=1 Tax=Ligilactobacillus salitolerans TaxID=1808352 RepID=A0A401IW90_9LACO|nr:peptidoglycan amidohydrolase family protein [Ligilactobacillus salitolerans]GBG95766.1 hypothetical protein LFYK43_22250 [Ligilactobacillus salitolerans]
MGETKRIIKMYRHRKTWVMVPLLLLSVISGIQLNESRVSAAESGNSHSVTVISEQNVTEINTDNDKASPESRVTDEKESSSTAENSDAIQEDSNSASKESSSSGTDTALTSNSSEQSSKKQREISKVGEKNPATSDTRKENTSVVDSSDDETKQEDTSKKDITKLESNKVRNKKGLMKKSSDQQASVREVRHDGHWYLVDQSGMNLTGFQTIPAGKSKKTVFYNSQGWMVYGQQHIQNYWYLFHGKTGAMQHGFQNVPKKNKVAYYDQDGKMVYRELHLNGHWYYLDDHTGAMAKGFKKVTGKNKTAYYDNHGWMVYGEKKYNGAWYHFNEHTGAMSTGSTYLSKGKKTVYYNSAGKMLYGWRVIGNHQYYFKPGTGARVSGRYRIGKTNYKFNKNGIFLGFTQRVLDWFFTRKNKITYSMYGSRNGSDGTADCSGSMTQALWKAGASKPASSAAQWGGYNTETIHGYLKNNGYSLVAAGKKQYTPRYGDIIIWGKLGASAGAAGHIQIVSTSGSNPKTVSTNASYRDSKGNMAKNRAIQEFEYQEYWKNDGKPYAYVYRPNNIHRM